MLREFIKDPSAVLDYVFNWEEWLGIDTIASHTVTASTGVTVTASTSTSTSVTTWVSGGTHGNYYNLVCRIVTVGGRTDERTILIYCLNR